MSYVLRLRKLNFTLFLQVFLRGAGFVHKKQWLNALKFL